MLKKKNGFNKGDKVQLQNYITEIWEKGEVVEKLKSLKSYKLQMENGKIFKRNNVIHIRKRKVFSIETTLNINKSLKISIILTPIITRSGREVKNTNILEIKG